MRTRRSSSPGLARRGSCTPISVRHRTAFRTSSSPAIRRACRSPSSTDDESDTGVPGLAWISDSGRGQDAGALHRGRCARWRHVRRSPSSPHRSRSLAALRDLRDAVERRGEPMGSGLRRDLRSQHQRSSSRHLDVGRRRRPGDPAGARALRRGVRRRRDHARVPLLDARDQWLCLAGVAPRRFDRRRAADGHPHADESLAATSPDTRRRSRRSSAR